MEILILQSLRITIMITSSYDFAYDSDFESAVASENSFKTFKYFREETIL